MPVDPFWTSAFLDFAPGSFEAGVRFWADVTGYALSPARGEHDEFASLTASEGDEYLKVQRLDDGPGRVHLDLHVADPDAAARLAVELGATLVHASPHGYVVLTSPAGVTFCLVSHPGRLRPRPAGWDTHTSLIDQLTLDVRAADADRETAFWSELTGWPPSPSTAPFRPLRRPAGMPLRLMVQAVEDDRSPATAHLDLACDDRCAETERHQVLGAAVRRVDKHFTVLTDPTGAAYCITDRDPVTGRLAP